MYKAYAEPLNLMTRGTFALMDFGCGPATAALAFADTRRNTPFHYWGIDRAQPMLSRANSFWQRAAGVGVTARGSELHLVTSWGQIPVDQILPGSAVLLNFSYFFASRSLTDPVLRSLVVFLERLQAEANVARLAFVYINSTYHTANQAWSRFKGMAHISTTPQEASISFKTRRGAVESKAATFVCEADWLKKGSAG